MLYVLQSDKTPFYVHAMILNSYIESAWKCLDGGSMIGKVMVKNIREHGGEIHRNTEREAIGTDLTLQGQPTHAAADAHSVPTPERRNN